MVTLILLLLLLIGGAAVAYTLMTTDPKQKRQQFLKRFGGLVGAQPQPLAGHENSYLFRFTFEGREYVFEDIEEPGLGQPTYSGVLKTATPVRLTLTFMEKTRSSIRSNITSVEEITDTWGHTKKRIHLPKTLDEFAAFCDDVERGSRLMRQETVVREFAKYKAMDNRGVPVESLEIIDGVVALRYHNRPELKPSLMALYHAPQIIENHLRSLNVVARELENLRVI